MYVHMYIVYYTTMNLLKVKYISIYNRYFCFYVIIGVLSSIALNFRDIEFRKKIMPTHSWAER